jgi:aminomethyltransferase
VALGGKLVPFAGWELPVQYAGILAEHRWTRESASLFDVSHMGQVEVSGRDAAAQLETLIPASLQALPEGRTRYAVITNDDGGIVDDLLVTRRAGDVLMVLNAARVDADLAWLRSRLPALAFRHRPERALLALQGPMAAAALSELAPAARELAPFAYGEFDVGGVPCTFSRSGYTGEDGFEIGCAGEAAVAVAEALLARPEVRPAGLGARDSLRLEAGLCLYGNDIDADTSPVEAGLAWTFGARRKAAALGVPGAVRIQRELAEGPARRRVGLLPEGRGLVRNGAVVRDESGHETGVVTSGSFSPSLGVPIAMGYVASRHAAPGTALQLDLRGRQVPARVAPLPFVPPRRHRQHLA